MFRVDGLSTAFFRRQNAIIYSSKKSGAQVTQILYWNWNPNALQRVLANLIFLAQVSTVYSRDFSPNILFSHKNHCDIPANESSTTIHYNRMLGEVTRRYQDGQLRLR